MVKITNPLGDVKIGRQGEVVYQRKYGEQIRRQVSPKRAMASEAQEKHRQLYRDALTWRSQLPLANRRYLDGYCRVNWVVDNYHIPLPWSRFALKLYLEKIKFVMVTKPVVSEEEVQGKYEEYQYVRPEGSSLYGTSWAGMSFTPLVSHHLNKVALILGRLNNPGICQISIRATDPQGHPAGSDLSLAEFNGSDLPPGEQTDMYYFDLPAVFVAKDTKYAIIPRAPSGNSSNLLYLRKDGTSPTYPRGNTEWSVDSGNSWTSYPGTDYYFEEWGYITSEETQPGLLHVRHPALLTVVHKRGELIVRAYDTLSSLDEEYLTKQVGLDVEAGDIIEATTLPGIEYVYVVR